MTKRLLNIDDELLEEAQRVSESKSMTETVNLALTNMVKSFMRQQHLDRLISMEGMDLDDQEVMKQAWQ